MTELSIPGEAIDVLGPAVYRWEIAGQSDDAARVAIRAITRPVLIAWLIDKACEIADELSGRLMLEWANELESDRG